MLLLLLALALRGASGLLCPCSYPHAKYCTASGVCDADEDGRHLKSYLASTRGFLNESRVGRDAGRRRVWEGICADLASTEHGAYFVIQEFQDWKPACATVENLQTCSLAPPATPEGGRVSPDQLNDKILDYFSRLGCHEAGFAPRLLNSSWHFCRHSHCNASASMASLTLPSPVRLSTEEVGEAWVPVVLYIVLPVLLALLLLGLIVACLCWRLSLWSYVFKLDRPTNSLPQLDKDCLPSL